MDEYQMRNKRFEKWYADRIGEPLSRVRDMYNGETYTDWDYHVETAWAAWCAALGFSEEKND
jgi:hypothetical protein